MKKAKHGAAKRSAAAKRPARKAPGEAVAPEEAPEDKLLEVEEADAQDLHEVESELGISEWVDPDTGDPAEDSVPRLEDH